MHGALYRRGTICAWRCSYSLEGGLRPGKMVLVRSDHSHHQSDTNSVKLDATQIRYVTTGHNTWSHTDRRELLESNYLKYCTVRQTMLFNSSGASFLKLDTSRSSGTSSAISKCLDRQLDRPTNRQLNRPTGRTNMKNI